MSILPAWTCVSLSVLLTLSAHACVEEAASRYGVPAVMLRAIAQQESSNNARAWHLNADGTVDIGLMQINSRWIPRLRTHGIQAQDLWDPCVSYMVGAWLLSDSFIRKGYNLQGLGAYHSPDPDRQRRYAREVLSKMQSIRQSQGTAGRSLTPAEGP